jgi:flagellar motility protein MotE (MotC chaperone)
MNRSQDESLIENIDGDSLIADTTIIEQPVDSLSLMLDSMKPTFLNRREIQTELKEHEENYLILAKKIRDLYSEKDDNSLDEKDFQAIMDSTLNVMSTKVDSLKNAASLMLRDNNTLLQAIEVKNQQLQEQSKIIEDLNAKIIKLEEEIDVMLNPPDDSEEQLDFKKIARIYNNMDAKKIAQLMQNMPSDKSVNILKNMNQRKVAQVLAALPPNIATQYSQLLMN